MQHTKILIIGQGISGTMLSWYLTQANIAHLVIDDNATNTASKVAAGIINPVTGRRIVATWLIDTIMPHAVQAYTQLEAQLGTTLIQQKNILETFVTAQMQQAFAERKNNTDNKYLQNYDDVKNNLPLYHNIYGYGTIAPSYVVNVALACSLWQAHLQRNNQLITEKFKVTNLQLNPTSVVYGNITAQRIIFANGYAASELPWFANLPFAPNKGEALLIHAPSLPNTYIYKRGLTIAPLSNHNFWVGANYLWKYEHELPTKEFYTNTNIALQSWLNIPYTVTKHIAAIRPATLERRPFVGFHPLHSTIGIIAGMGAKGTSLAPYFAQQLVQHIIKGTVIHPEANINRFSKVLLRN